MMSEVRLGAFTCSMALVISTYPFSELFDPVGLLNWGSDDGETAMSHDRMAAENRTHVDDLDPGASPRRLECPREPRDSGPDYDEVGRGFALTGRSQQERQKKNE